MTPAQAMAFAGPVAAASTVVAQSAIEDGLNRGSAWSVGLIVGGVAVFTFLDRRNQKQNDETNALRRAEDIKREDRIAQLETRIELLQAQHVAEVQRLTDRIIHLLQEGKP